MAESVGMMEGAFFVGKGELFAWLNEFFGLSVTKVEQCASGAVYCQIFDAVHPGKVQMTKVNWGAKLDYEFIKNYKVLQSAFDKVGLKKHIEVDKLIKAKPLDNLEFLQFCKAYFDKCYCGQNYDAVERRVASGSTMLDWAKPSQSQSKQRLRSSSAVAPVSRPTTNSRKDTSAAANRSSAVGGAGVGEGPIVTDAPVPTGALAGGAVEVHPVGSYHNKAEPLVEQKIEAQNEIQALNEKIAKLQEDAAENELVVEGLEKERDFYFRKLRDIEIHCQESLAVAERGETVDGKESLMTIQRILYEEPEGDAMSDGEAVTGGAGGGDGMAMGGDSSDCAGKSVGDAETAASDTMAENEDHSSLCLDPAGMKSLRVHEEHSLERQRLQQQRSEVCPYSTPELAAQDAPVC
eukprot:Filipodium_phascolosomae@DN334_c0_g1_i1.p1